MKTFKKLGGIGLGSALLASSLAALFVALLIPALAYAQVAVTTTDAPQTSLDKLSTQLMDVLVPAFVTLIGVFVTWLIHKARQKFSIQVSDQTIDAWANLARKAALRGAEWARNEAKRRLEGEKIPGPEILDVAANWALDLSASMGLPDIGRKKLEALIEAELFQLRREGTPPGAPPV